MAEMMTWNGMRDVIASGSIFTRWQWGARPEQVSTVSEPVHFEDGGPWGVTAYTYKSEGLAPAAMPEGGLVLHSGTPAEVVERIVEAGYAVRRRTDEEVTQEALFWGRVAQGYVAQHNTTL